MSVKLMSLVFEADIPDLEYTKDGETRKAKASTVNSILLAYADHANDEGEGSYPGYTRLERKTKLSRQGIADTIEACKQNGYLEFTGKSKLDTNSYTLNKSLLETLNTPIMSESSHLTLASQATLPARVKPLDLNHPLTITKPHKSKTGASARPPTPPEVKLFREVTRRYPHSANFDGVVESIGKVGERLGRAVIADDLKSFYSAWTSKGYNPLNLAWLEWAETGQIPVNGNWKAQKFTNEPKAYNGIRDFLQEQSYAVTD